MRLAVLDGGHRLRNRLFLRVVGAMSPGGRPPDVLRTLQYRPAMLGGPLSEITQAVMRGPSEWSVGQRELFAAFTSKLNACLF
ncbi:MAG TPA: hypothetical protein VGL20_06965 [Candidatus Dormibacteraeota bacterium]